MRPVLKLGGLVHHAEVGFVHQRGGLQGGLMALAPQMGGGNFPQFPIYQWSEHIQRIAVPFRPAAQKEADLTGGLHATVNSITHPAWLCRSSFVRFDTGGGGRSRLKLRRPYRTSRKRSGTTMRGG